MLKFPLPLTFNSAIPSSVGSVNVLFRRSVTIEKTGLGSTIIFKIWESTPSEMVNLVLPAFLPFSVISFLPVSLDVSLTETTSANSLFSNVNLVGFTP